MNKLIIKTVPSFDRQAQKLLSTQAQEDLFDYLEANPESGVIVAGTGGIRKLRWVTGKDNKGKSSGVRVLYHYSREILIILIMLYKKNEVESMSESDKNALKKLMPQLVHKYKEEGCYNA